MAQQPGRSERRSVSKRRHAGPVGCNGSFGPAQAALPSRQQFPLEGAVRRAAGLLKQVVRLSFPACAREPN